MLQKNITIDCKASTEAGLDAALEEAIRLIQEGYTSGMDRNDEGSFNFTVAFDMEGD